MQDMKRSYTLRVPKVPQNYQIGLTLSALSHMTDLFGFLRHYLFTVNVGDTVNVGEN